jgi:hypothetical protein
MEKKQKKKENRENIRKKHEILIGTFRKVPKTGKLS